MQTYLQTCKHGSFLLLRADFISDCMSLYGEWAEREVQLFDSLLSEGNVVVEVGSNIGTHAVAIAKKIGSSGQLVCLEAQRLLFQILTANIALNNLSNVRTICAVGAEKSGSILLKEADFTKPTNRGAYSVPSNIAGEIGERTTVLSIDHIVEIYNLNRFDLLKIDVEGMEENVLRGAEKTLKSFCPYLFFECGNWQNQNSHQKADAMHLWLGSLGYKLYWYNCLGFNPQNFRGVSENRVGAFGDINIVGIPAPKSPPAGLKEVISVNEIFKGDIMWVNG